MKQVYLGTVVVALWIICFCAHSGLAIFLGALAGLAASIYWLVGSRSIFRVGLATLMTVLVYFLSVSPFVELVLGPRLEQAFVGDGDEPRWYDDYWESYATPWAKACDTEIGKKILMPYHRSWVSN